MPVYDLVLHTHGTKLRKHILIRYMHRDSVRAEKFSIQFNLKFQLYVVLYCLTCEPQLDLMVFMLSIKKIMHTA